MSANPLWYFVLGLAASFVGTLPFGPVNLSAVDTTLKKSLRAGLYLSVAAALVEIIQGFIAVHCSMYISEHIAGNPSIKIGVIILFIILGVVFFFKKPPASTSDKPKKRKLSSFAKGALLGLLNPQALPFWVFVVTYYEMMHWVDMNFSQQLWLAITFLLGVSVGKLLALMLYCFLSVAISKKVSSLSRWMNKIIGSIFLVIGAYQGIQLLIST